MPQPQPIVGRLETPDLTYRVWINERTTPRTAMIVFRGTFLPLDWYSNLRWVTAAIPRVEDHYDQTIAMTGKVVEHIKTRYGADTVIFSAGHSLGGGLAQTAAYKACGDIRTVFAFDSSPVTKNRVRKQCDTGRTADTFYRIFEQSEILSYARFWIRLVLGLRKEDPHFTEIKVRCGRLAPAFRPLAGGERAADGEGVEEARRDVLLLLGPHAVRDAGRRVMSAIAFT